VIVQNGPQVIFFDENAEVLATPAEDTLTDQE
jgi:hypothetical protein